MGGRPKWGFNSMNSGLGQWHCICYSVQWHCRMMITFRFIFRSSLICHGWNKNLSHKFDDDHGDIMSDGTKIRTLELLPSLRLP